MTTFVNQAYKTFSGAKDHITVPDTCIDCYPEIDSEFDELEDLKTTYTILVEEIFTADAMISEATVDPLKLVLKRVDQQLRQIYQETKKYGAD
jgi:hypothetical protein